MLVTSDNARRNITTNAPEWGVSVKGFDVVRVRAGAAPAGTECVVSEV